MTKAEARREASKQRNSLSGEEVTAASQLMLDRFSKLDFSELKVLHLFLPIIKKNEPNTLLFIDWMKQNQPAVKLIVPRADFSTSLMTNYVYKGAKELELNAYGIPEPKLSEPYTGEVDMVLVPLLAFDLRGYRVGYGKGFYDRFLTGKNIKKIGLSFFEALDEITDVNDQDVKMNYCITPERIYKFS